MLTLIGTGVCFDLTADGVAALRKSSEIYIETYTNLISEEKISALEKTLNTKIIRLGRKDVESSFLIKRARNAYVSLLVSGDPLIATTHLSLILDAKKAGVETRIVHNSSIYTAAAGKAGMQMYKFGRTCSIPNPRPNYAPTSWFDMVKENLGRDAHTLVLLDTEPQPMDAKTALDLIEGIDRGGLLKNKSIVALSRVGELDEKISCGEMEKLKKSDLGKPPFVLIIPGKLHMVEEEYLNYSKVLM